MEYEGTMYRYIHNLQGDIVAIVDSTGKPVVEYKYDAWGKHVGTVSENGIGALNPFRYRGYVWDTEIEMYYLKSRFYNSQISRFTSIDAVIKTNSACIGINPVVYCRNNPIKFFDTSGFSEIPAYNDKNIFYEDGVFEEDYNVELIIHVPYNEDIAGGVIGHIEVAIKYDETWRIYSYGPQSTSGLTPESGSSQACLTVRSYGDMWGNRATYETYVIRMWAFPGAIENTMQMIADDLGKPFVAQPTMKRYNVVNPDYNTYSLVSELGNVCRDYSNRILQSLGSGILEDSFDTHYPSSFLGYVQRNYGS